MQRHLRRENHPASTVDAGCTAPPLAYGMSPAGPYLVMTHLPGYRSGTTMMGRSPPAVGLWAFGLEVASVHASGILHQRSEERPHAHRVRPGVAAAAAGCS